MEKITVGQDTQRIMTAWEDAGADPAIMANIIQLVKLVIEGATPKEALLEIQRSTGNSTGVLLE